MISVVIPVYNGARYLKETIQSIQRSTYQDLEIIAVDDGSVDDSPQILQQLQNEDPRIRIITGKNEGVVAARNAGVQAAQGDYLCFCDQDDLVEPACYERLVARMEQDGSEMAMCSSARLVKGQSSPYDILEDGVYEGDKIRMHLIYPLLFNGYRVPFLQEAGNHYPNIWVCLFRRSFFVAMGFRFRSYVNFEDDLLVKLESLSNAQKVSTISEIGYMWRINEHSETYARHFVEDIGAKQERCLRDQVRSLRAANAPSREIRWFCRVTRCKQYIDAMHNLTCDSTRKTFSYIRAYCREQIYSRHFADSIRALRYLRPGRIIPGRVLPLLRLHLPIAAYCMQIFLEYLLRLSLRSRHLTKLERRLKGKAS